MRHVQQLRCSCATCASGRKEMCLREPSSGCLQSIAQLKAMVQTLGDVLWLYNGAMSAAAARLASPAAIVKLATAAAEVRPAHGSLTHAGAATLQGRGVHACMHASTISCTCHQRVVLAGASHRASHCPSAGAAASRQGRSGRGRPGTRGTAVCGGQVSCSSSPSCSTLNLAQGSPALPEEMPKL